MIEIKGLTVSFNNFSALDDITLTIEDGSFISVVGPNGGGKSTLLKAIIGLLKPSSGEILLDGTPPEKHKSGELAYVPQIKTMDREFPALAIELVINGIIGTWTSRISKSIWNQGLSALEQVGAGHLASRQLSRLSGGELQRVYLARSFVCSPKVLLLDEPASGIDVAGEKDIHKLIDDFQQKTGAIVIMVTHDWETAYHHADKLLLLNRKVICYNSPQIAFNELHIRQAFGHLGHNHSMIIGDQLLGNHRHD